MLYKSQIFKVIILSLGILVLASLSCQITGSATQTAPLKPEIILQRLNVAFLGPDGKKVIGSGCPGNDGKGAIIDYHFMIGGVDENKEVQRILVAGDNSTLTWELPCNNNWALKATNLGNGIWEIFIAPSLSSKVYTVLFFYTDNTIALGMVNVE
jgi:hypothetical protein